VGGISPLPLLAVGHGALAGAGGPPVGRAAGAQALGARGQHGELVVVQPAGPQPDRQPALG